ncbi:phage Gp37Gp68 family protein [Caballeronia temeraria]|uniref:Phage Gp37Gp68 family protein n=2 Tax=Caballeronia TaxID=1827195 RepID=A0A158DNF2_9BURK|nr:MULTISPECIES: phage Gp37/Gp68 family protein [Caballeronia]SAK57612.1 phage Gp37Gp68 family protein [Caballeronia temeraria]SAK96128.1 phage Gp37Gp68 family protein [Caballeronia catudaia]
MSENGKIEWTDHTFNPWSGCTKVSPGCDHCYAESMMDTRLHRVRWGAGQPRVRTSHANWRKPLQWNAQADAFFAKHGRRQRVFCASLADVFDNAVDPAWRVDLFDLIDSTQDLDWLLLTKRIGSVVPMIREVAAQRPNLWYLHEPRLPDNVWLGATVVNQTEADRDISKLLATPVRVKFLSMEPLLGAVDIGDWLTPSYPHCGTGFSQGGGMADGYCGTCAGHASDPIHKLGRRDLIDWVIVGGESGFGARPMHHAWARSLRDQCAAVGVPFLFKQWGEWYPMTVDGEKQTARLPDAKEVALDRQYGVTGARSHEWAADAGRVAQPSIISIALGKKSAGRLLDGRVHDEFPRHEVA